MIIISPAKAVASFAIETKLPWHSRYAFTDDPSSPGGEMKEQIIEFFAPLRKNIGDWETAFHTLDASFTQNRRTDTVTIQMTAVYCKFAAPSNSFDSDTFAVVVAAGVERTAANSIKSLGNNFGISSGTVPVVSVKIQISEEKEEDYPTRIYARAAVPFSAGFFDTWDESVIESFVKAEFITQIEKVISPTQDGIIAADFDISNSVFAKAEDGKVLVEIEMPTSIEWNVDLVDRNSALYRRKAQQIKQLLETGIAETSVARSMVSGTVEVEFSSANLGLVRRRRSGASPGRTNVLIHCVFLFKSETKESRSTESIDNESFESETSVYESSGEENIDAGSGEGLLDEIEVVFENDFDNEPKPRVKTRQRRETLSTRLPLRSLVLIQAMTRQTETPFSQISPLLLLDNDSEPDMALVAILISMMSETGNTERGMS